MQPTRDTNSSRYTAENHGEVKTWNIPILSYNGPRTGCWRMKSLTATGVTFRCGTSDPGMAATARVNSSASAVRIDVS